MRNGHRDASMLGAIVAAYLTACSAARVHLGPSRPPSQVPVAQLSAAWPMYQAGPTHNAVFPSSKLDVSWIVKFGAKINAGLAVNGSTIYTDSFDHNIYALDIHSGRQLWVTAANNIVMSTPSVKDGIVVVRTGRDGWLNRDADEPNLQIWGRPEGDDVLALSAATGKLLWKYHTVGDDMASAAIDGETVVFANGDLHAYGLDLRSGALRWKTDLNGVASMDSTTVDRHLAFIGTCRIHPQRCETDAVDTANGAIKWRADIGSADASPAAADGIVVINMLQLDNTGKYDQGGSSIVEGVDEKTGRTRWKWESAAGPCSFVGSGEHEIAPVIDRGLVIDAVGCRSDVVALDLKSGKMRWMVRAFAHVKMSPIVYKGHVYFGDTNGVFYDVSEATGESYRNIPFDQMFTTAPFVIVGHTLIATCNDEIFAVPALQRCSPLYIDFHDMSDDHPIENKAI